MATAAPIGPIPKDPWTLPIPPSRPGLAAPRRSGARRRVRACWTPRSSPWSRLATSHTTTTAVCERAGLSRGAQLHHFPTKSELVIAAVAHLAMRRAKEVREEAKRLAGLDDRIEAALELIWTSFSGPLFYAALELWVAARTDAELHENLFRFERGVGKAMGQLWQEFAGESQAEKLRFDDVLELTFSVMRGMALQKILKDNDTERRRLYEVWKRLVAEALGNESLWASEH